MGNWGIDEIFALTILVLFLVTLLGAVLRRYARDKCLRLFDGFHVTWLPAQKPAMWGRMETLSQGILLAYDSPVEDPRGLTKAASLIYEDELTRMLALLRTRLAMSSEEQLRHAAQVQRLLNPSLWQRLSRRLKNLVSMVRDAIVGTLALLLGRLSSSQPAGAALRTQSQQITAVGSELIGTLANAYEPLLERHLGQPVVVEIRLPEGSPRPALQFPGYLAEYSERYVVLVNPDQGPVEEIELEVPPGGSDIPGLASLARNGEALRVEAIGEDAILLKSLEADGRKWKLGVVLIPGSFVRLSATAKGWAKLVVARLRRLDIICPRTVARVRYSSAGWEWKRRDRAGLGPAEETEREPASLVES